MNETTASPNFSHMLYNSDNLRIGRFHAPCDHPQFGDSGKIQLPTMVFPRSSVMIEPDNQPSFLSNISKVNLYDDKHEYRRKSVANNDDICDWFEFDLSLFGEDMQWRSNQDGLGHLTP